MKTRALRLRCQNVGEHLARPVRQHPASAHRASQAVAHAVLEGQVHGPAIDADGLDHAPALGPGEGSQAHPGHHDAGVVGVLAVGRIVLPPSARHVLVHEHGLAELHRLPVADLGGKAAGAEHVQRRGLRCGFVERVEHGVWSFEFASSRGEGRQLLAQKAAARDRGRSPPLVCFARRGIAASAVRALGLHPRLDPDKPGAARPHIQDQTSDTIASDFANVRPGRWLTRRP